MMTEEGMNLRKEHLDNRDIIRMKNCRRLIYLLQYPHVSASILCRVIFSSVGTIQHPSWVE